MSAPTDHAGCNAERSRGTGACASRLWLAVALVMSVASATSRAGVGDPLNTSTYEYQMKITFSGYTGTSTLTNFPALVVLNTGITGFDYGQLLSGGADLRFADATGFELAYEIDTWNATGNSYIWVRVPQLAAATDYIRAYWGYAGAAAPGYASTTWSSWAAVWHLREAAAADSSSPAYTGVPGSVSTVGATGLVGTAQSFGGSAWINVSSVAPAVAGNTFTFSAAFRTTAVGDPSPVSVASASSSDKTAGRVWWRVGPSDVGSGEINVVDGTSTVAIDPDIAVNDDVWHTLDYVRNGSSGALYLDGVSVGTHTPTQTLLSTDLWSIGQRYATTGFKNPANFFVGLIDEVRVIATARNADWVKAADDTMRHNGAFTTYGAAQTAPKAGSAFFGW